MSWTVVKISVSATYLPTLTCCWRQGRTSRISRIIMAALMLQEAKTILCRWTEICLGRTAILSSHNCIGHLPTFSPLLHECFRWEGQYVDLKTN